MLCWAGYEDGGRGCRAGAFVMKGLGVYQMLRGAVALRCVALCSVSGLARARCCNCVEIDTSIRMKIYHSKMPGGALMLSVSSVQYFNVLETQECPGLTYCTLHDEIWVCYDFQPLTPHAPHAPHRGRQQRSGRGRWRTSRRLQPGAH